MRSRVGLLPVLMLCILALGCGGDADDGQEGPGGGGSVSNGSGSNGSGGSGRGGSGDDDRELPDPDRPLPEPPAARCEAPIGPVDSGAPDRVVGDGTPESCTEQALREAVEAGGVIRFDCGGPHTIDIREVIEVPIERDVTVDGGGEIILDGGRRDGHRTRIFRFYSPNYRAVETVFTLQRITLQNAEAPAEDFTPQDPANPRCAYGYKDGEGGAIYVRDGVLHVIDVVFRDNKAASPGPDTGGGAIYAVGSLEVLVVDSVFENNEGSNAGAVGLLQSDGLFFNSVFADNRATGTGANFGGATECPEFNHAAQGGAGGNAGAVGIDGGSVARTDFCGVTFRGNEANALGTVARTPNSQRETMRFERCWFQGNHTGEGGSGIYTQDMDLVIDSCSFVDNTSGGSGGAVRLEQGVHGSTLELVNSTFHRNRVMRALGGALVFDGPGQVRHCTFSENEAVGGYDPDAEAAFFGAAISGGGMSIHNTIFVDNRDTHPWTPMTCHISEPLAGSHNLQWPRQRIGEDGNPSDQDDNPCTTDVIWQDARLGDLGDHGGELPVRVPLAGSPAIGIADDCLPVDQRGQLRPATGCTAGAVEPD